MGSYLSIVNNTEDEWRCTVGTDETSLKIAGLVLAGIGAAASTVLFGSVGLSLLAKLTVDGATLLGVSTASIVSGTATATGVASVFLGSTGATSNLIYIRNGVNEILDQQDYKTIAPGSDAKWGPMTLSLIQQATCTRSYVLNEYTLRTETLVMRPITSGSTMGDVRPHDIKYWLQEKGVKTHDTAFARPQLAQPASAARVVRSTGGTVNGTIVVYHPNQPDQDTVLDSVLPGDWVAIVPQ